MQRLRKAFLAVAMIFACSGLSLYAAKPQRLAANAIFGENLRYCSSAIEKLIMAERPHDRKPDPITMRPSPGQWFEVHRSDQGRVVRTDAIPTIDTNNIESLFTHEYRPGMYGAKALSLVPQKAERGDLFFWRTGVASHSIEFHHRDALAFLNERHAAELAEKRLTHERDLETLGDLLAKAIPMGLAPMFEGIVRRKMEKRLDKAVENEEKSEHAKRYSHLLSSVRKLSTFSPFDLIEGAGFQLTAERRAGRLQITAFDMDSSITSAQLKRMEQGSEWTRGWDPELAPEDNLETNLNASIQSVHDAISPEVRAYKTIRIKRLSEFIAAGIHLKAPEGLRLEELPAEARDSRR